MFPSPGTSFQHVPPPGQIGLQEVLSSGPGECLPPLASFGFIPASSMWPYGTDPGLLTPANTGPRSLPVTPCPETLGACRPSPAQPLLQDGSPVLTWLREQQAPPPAWWRSRTLHQNSLQRNGSTNASPTSPYLEPFLDPQSG